MDLDLVALMVDASVKLPQSYSIITFVVYLGAILLAFSSNSLGAFVAYKFFIGLVSLLPVLTLKDIRLPCIHS